MKKFYNLLIACLVLLCILVLAVPARAQSQIVTLNVWNPSNNAIPNYPVWVKVHTTPPTILRGNTNASGTFLDSIFGVPNNTRVDFLTYNCTGQRVTKTKFTNSVVNSIGDTLQPSCSVPKPEYSVLAFKVSGSTTVNLHAYNLDTALPADVQHINNWNFGDGSQSSSRVTSHTYTPGSYTACFTGSVHDSLYGIELFTDSMCIPINVGITTTCTAWFQARPDGGNDVQFLGTSNSSGVPAVQSYAYSWNFGDGSTGTGRTPVHTYSNSSHRIACFTAYGLDSNNDTVCTQTYCDSVYPGYPLSSGAGCNAQYVAVADPINPLSYNFIDSSSLSGSGSTFKSIILVVEENARKSWTYLATPNTWSPGNSFNHIFQGAGTFNVCLYGLVQDTLTNAISCASKYCSTITVGSGPAGCQADFGYSNTSGSGTFNFSDSSTVAPGANVSYTWYFGDGNVDTVQNPVHTYATSGTYNTCLAITVQDSSGTCVDSICKTVSWSSGPNVTCSADFSWQVDSSGSALFDASSSTVSAPYTISSYNWDFGDGTTGTGQIVSYTYGSAGGYTVCLTIDVLDSNGSVCSSTFCDSVIVPPATPFCQASYIIDNVNSYYSNVYIWNMSQPSYYSPNHTISYLWNFGDGKISNQAFPVHVYNNPGAYNVCLSITAADSIGNICTDTFCDTLGVDSLGNVIYKNGQSFTLNVLNPESIGIEEFQRDVVQLYPNPATDQVTLDWGKALKGELRWTVTDLKGAVMQQGTEETNGKTKTKVDVSHLGSGVYILSVQNETYPVAHYKLRVN